jgi:tRNA A37 threonylcarbamoyltransferase TsaD
MDLGCPEDSDVTARGDPQKSNFPRAYLAKGSLDFSFSGLKTATAFCIILQKQGTAQD